MSTMFVIRLMITLVLVCAGAVARQVTVSNALPRLDTSGNIIDCHSGVIVAHNGTYFMYGERYGNSTGFGPSPPVESPKLVVYTSSDFVAWTFRGFILPSAQGGTYFTPWAVFNKATGQFVLWFNAYVDGCCNGNWGVATSPNGVNFTVVSYNVSGTYGVVDGNGLFVDDDGHAYNVYTSEAQNHRVSIESLDATYTGVVAGGNFGLFPDTYVEGASLWKRGGAYYVGYGSCCCFCRGGSGWVVYKSTAGLAGPWTRQPLDLNCNSTTPGDICGAYGERPSDPIRVPAQGIGLSLLPTTDGSTGYLWSGERWLSAAYNNPTCPDECRPTAGECAEPANYIKGNGFSYWTLLSFDAAGNVLPFDPFVSTFTLDLADTF